MRSIRKSIIFFLLLGLSTLLFSCDGDNGGPTGPTVPNISGTWDFTLTITEGTCRAPGTTLGGTGSITQSGNNVTMVAGDTTFTGTLEGNQLSLEGSWSKPPKSAKHIIKGIVSSDGRSMSGTYEKIGSGGECSEKGTITSTKR